MIGSLSFSEFMQKALYEPYSGYYASGRVRIGKTGDFFTNVSVGKIYGKILAFFFEELWEKMDRPHSFTIVEQGAHHGQLALDILEVAKTSSDFFSALHYYIVEPFSIPQKEQQKNLKSYRNVFWVNQLEKLPAFEGVHFSNELIDAFPVHLLHWNGKEWLEQRVLQHEKENYSWILALIEQEELRTVVEKLPRDLPVPFLWEARLGITDWLQKIHSRMKRGLILIADYGYAGPQRFASYRAEGSIACYQNHHRYNNPLEDVGQRDITAHVDFTDLAEQALQQHFEILGYTDQHHFLIGAAETWLRTFEGKSLTAAEQKEFRFLQTLLHPETMGRAFQFLGLEKRLYLTLPLSGFRYQRPGLDALFEN